MDQGPGVRDELPGQPWSVELAVLDGRTRLTVRGELDAATADDLRTHITGTSTDDVELDLAAVSFIDSSGLAAVIEAHLRLADQQRRLVLVARSAMVDRVLELAGVAGRLGIEPS